MASWVNPASFLHLILNCDRSSHVIIFIIMLDSYEKLQLWPWIYIVTTVTSDRSLKSLCWRSEDLFYICRKQRVLTVLVDLLYIKKKRKKFEVYIPWG